MAESNPISPKPSIDDVLRSAPWVSLEVHLNTLHERVDGSIQTAHRLREQFRTELLSSRKDILEKIRRPSPEAITKAEQIFRHGIVAAADGTVAPVPLLGGTKIQIGVVLVSNRGDVVDLVTRVFETELSSGASTAGEFFSNLRTSRKISNLLSRAIMLFGERKLLLQHDTEWRFLHGELIPHELRTGATRPEHNLPPTFELIHNYITTGKFIAVSEGRRRKSPHCCATCRGEIILWNANPG